MSDTEAMAADDAPCVPDDAAPDDTNGDLVPPSDGAAEHAQSSPNANANPESAKATTSPAKKTARPGKAKASAPGGSKKGATSSEPHTFEFSDTVLARLRGFPPWPARICDPEALPHNVLAQRPGKNSQYHCVQFFPAGDFSWLHFKDLKPLSKKNISDYVSETHRKAAGGLMDAYKTAQDPTEWESQQAEQQQFLLDQEAEANKGVDELEDETGEGAGGGKRKRASAEKSQKKKAKTDKKSKSEAPADAPKSAAKPKSKAAPKSAGAKEQKKPDSKTEAQPTADDDPLASDPECARVKDWRHKLQRAFLGRSLPSDDEMDTYHDLFKTIEEYKSITIEALQYSKIGKVMKKIAVLDGIARDAELKIRERAEKLMHEWTDFINANEAKTNGGPAANSTEKKPADEAMAEGPTEVTTKEPAAPAENEPDANGEKMEVDAGAEAEDEKMEEDV